MTGKGLIVNASSRPGRLGPFALVFFASAAVLVVEVTALRLLAPHFGLTLETSTFVIGLALTAIAAGSWLGGRVADARARDDADPAALLPALFIVSGAAVAVAPFLVRRVASSAAVVLLVVAFAIIASGLLLSAVTPIMTKVHLASLDDTGATVGRFSAVSTAGAIAGTVVTGFVLLSRAPVSWILAGLGGVLIVVGASLGLRSRRASAAAVAGLLTCAGLGAMSSGGCDAETKYHCAVVQADPERPGGRTLFLDGLANSYVDLGDPTFMKFGYVQAVRAVLDTHFPAGMAVRAHFIGAGGVTLPRYLAHARRGSMSTVSEIDAGVIGLDRQMLGLTHDPGVDIYIEDGRRGLSRLLDHSLDVVVGDAFSGVSVPWHLTTRETVAEIRRTLRTGGVYVVNVIDHPPLAFAKAEVATIAEAFGHVVFVTKPGVVAGTDGGNVVIVASDGPIGTGALRDALPDMQVVDDGQARRWADGAPVLTDDYAPVDQLLTPFG